MRSASEQLASTDHEAELASGERDHGRPVGATTRAATPPPILPSDPSLVLQAKLTVGDASDPREREADAVAADFAAWRSSADAAAVGDLPVVDDEDAVARKESELPSVAPADGSGFEAPRDVEVGIERARGGGSELPGGLRGDLEQFLSADLSSVRVHNDGASADLAHSVGAKAFTTGSDIFMGAGASVDDTQLMAHEVAHVVQQAAVGRLVADDSMSRMTDASGACGCGSCRIERTTTDVVQREGGGGGGAPAPAPEKVAGTHGVLEVAEAKTADTIRSTVQSASPADAGGFLAARVQELQGLGLKTTVSSVDELAAAYASDLARQRGQEVTPELLAEAKKEIEQNKTSALTTSDDHYVAFADGCSFDEIHEFVHICSAPGGMSPLKGFQNTLNEGAINYFAEQTATAMGAAIAGRYPEGTAVAKAIVGAVGEAALYNATFKGDVNGLCKELGAKFAGSGTRLNGKNKGFSEKSWTAEQASSEFESMLKAWSANSIKNHLLG